MINYFFIFLIPSLGMVAGLSVAATVTVFLLISLLQNIAAWIPNRHCEEQSIVTISFNILRLLRQLLCNFLAMTIKTELLFAGWCLISCLFAIKPTNNLINFVQVFTILFLGFVVSNFKPFQNRPQLKKALIFGTLTAILLFFIEYFSPGFLTKIFKANFNLYMLDRGCALLSITAWVVIAILIYDKKYYHALILYILVLYLLSISDSLASFLGFSLGGIVFILARLIKPIFSKLIIFGLITGSLLFPVIAIQINPKELSDKYLSTHPSAAHRLFIWHFVANKIAEKPLMINGFNSSKYIEVKDSEMIDYKGEKWHPLPLHPHNNILQITLELGLVGLALFLILIYKYLKQIGNIGNDNFRASSYACFINYYIIGMISYNVWQIWWVASSIWVLILMKLLVKPDIVIDK
ncbi:O-antigen ligase [Rickettsia endosymbiont of Seladonia tumulorum]|uniref:O-antigen ligase family protein n=1 Tax=Rickettsia endosymbiont of Seladonia tumulorum TaxID=3066270 RepID=UPI00313BA1FC